MKWAYHSHLATNNQQRATDGMMDVELGYLDEDLLIAWKPHGMLTSGNAPATFRQKVQSYVINKDLGSGKVEPCHRLDFETSGWVIFGLNEHSIRVISSAFEKRLIDKSYFALVHGHLESRLDIRFQLNGKQAKTIVRRIQNGKIAGAGNVSFVLITIESGRTHQIRRHLSSIGHSIVGDLKYPGLNKVYQGKGLFLCAHHLSIPHPNHKNPVEVCRLPSKKFLKIPFIHQIGLDDFLGLS